MSGLHKLEIDNSKAAAVQSGKWKNPGAKLYDRLLNSFKLPDDVLNDPKKFDDAIKNKTYLQWNDYLKEAYLIAPVDTIKNSPYGITPFSRSGCKYPHHVVKGDQLVLSVPGVKAAYARAKQMGEFKGEVKEHLMRHFKDLGLESYIHESESLDKIESNFNDIYRIIFERFGIDLRDPDYDSMITEATRGFDKLISDISYQNHINDSKILESNDFDTDVYMDEYLNKTTDDLSSVENQICELFTWIESAVENGVSDSDTREKDATLSDHHHIYENNSQNNEDDPPSIDEPNSEEPSDTEERKEVPQSMPKQTDTAESNKNGVRRKKLYVAFIEWCKEYNSKNTFGSIFDKDVFKISYPFVPEEMRYFYRLANPLLCVLSGDLTFFQVSELRKLNSRNSKLNEMMIFAATQTDVRVFNTKDKKVYRGTDEAGALTLHEVLGETFDTYIQKMIGKGDILNAPLESDQNS